MKTQEELKGILDSIHILQHHIRESETPFKMTRNLCKMVKNWNHNGHISSDMRFYYRRKWYDAYNSTKPHTRHICY